MVREKPKQGSPQPLVVRLLGVLMTLVFSGVGALALVFDHAPERWTKLGYVAPLDGIPAHHFGLAITLFGLMPLMLAAPNRKWALWIGILPCLLGLAVLFFGSPLPR